jgi:hypothetical protein
LTQQLTTPPRQKLLDEAAFQELLAAAFVLQQHNQLDDNPSTSPTEVVTEIVRIQRLIRGGESNLVETARLISEQAHKFTKADGVAIGIVSGEDVIYLAAIGIASRDLGRRFRQNDSLSENCIRTGLTFQTSNTYDDRRMDPLRDFADVRSFVGVPVSFANKVAAVLEMRFRTANAFTEGDVHNCELIAALVKELITQAGQSRGPRENRRTGSQSSDVRPGEIESTSTRENEIQDRENEAVKIDALRVQFADPQNAELPPIREGNDKEQRVAEHATNPVAEASSNGAAVCRGCGQHFAKEEVFCGKCGMKRTMDADGPLQAKWASLWYMNQARPLSANEENGTEVEENVGALSLARPHKLEEDDSYETDERVAHDSDETSNSALSLHSDKIAIEEAASQPLHVEWLPDANSPAPENWLQRQWRVNRANFYLGGAALLLIAVLSGLGSTSYSSAPTNGPQLSLFERMLVGLGIAEAPQSAAKLGNPDTPVWVDLHTALYYCPGSEQYGRTDGGKIATQRSAQMDQFEPAHRKVCN